MTRVNLCLKVKPVEQIYTIKVGTLQTRWKIKREKTKKEGQIFIKWEQFLGVFLQKPSMVWVLKVSRKTRQINYN